MYYAIHHAKLCVFIHKKNRLLVNARGKGGKPIVNLLQALLHKSLTPSQHLRSVLSDPEVKDFKSAVRALSVGQLIDEAYVSDSPTESKLNRCVVHCGWCACG